MKTTFLLLVILATSLPISNYAQTSTDDNVRFMQSRLFDVGSAEYKLTPQKNGRGIEFTNTSSNALDGFQLGCVKRKNAVLQILSSMEFTNELLAAATEKDIYDVTFWDSNHGIFPPSVDCKKGKLAIIKVHLSNGSLWELK